MKNIILIFSVCLFLITGCAQNNDHVVTIKTSYGDMVAILYDETPKHKKNFIKLAKEHFYDSTLFHRVIEGFMIQGGDPDSRKASADLPLGRGGPGYTIEAEFNPKYFHEKGALSAARLNDQQNPAKASNGSQFYIVHGTTMSEEEIRTDQIKLNQALEQFFQNPEHSVLYDTVIALYQSGRMKAYRDFLMKIKPQVEQATGMSMTKDVAQEVIEAYTTVGGAPTLDGAYTVFGRVIKGLDVIDKIAAVPKGGGDRPLEDIRMTVTVEELPKKQIEKIYGYKYPEK